MANPNNHTPPGDTAPRWYRQFWPWFLIILPGTVVVASLVTVYIAFKGADNLVVEDYYKEGLAINKTVDDLNTAKSLGLEAKLSFTGNTLQVMLTPAAAVGDRELLLSFQHPLDNKQDISVTVQQTGNGVYSVVAPALAAGKWYIAVQSTTAAKPWRLTTIVYLPAAETIIRPE